MFNIVSTTCTTAGPTSTSIGKTCKAVTTGMIGLAASAGMTVQYNAICVLARKHGMLCHTATCGVDVFVDKACNRRHQRCLMTHVVG